MTLDIGLLESSFAQIKQHGRLFTEKFYQTLFADHPEIWLLFAHSQIDEQGNMLLRALIMIIDNLEKPAVLTAALHALGARHAEYGVVAEHYAMLQVAWLKTLAIFLQENWTPQLKQVWEDLYSLIARLMLEGAALAC